MKLNSDIAFTPAVKQAQRERGSRETYQRALTRRDWSDTITADLADFIAQRDQFYLGTASADGQPYIQFRGGPKGFLKVIDDRHLAFADFSGNRQYISLGNLAENDRAFIFLIDYTNRVRIKLWGRAKFVEDDPALIAQLEDPTYKAKVERALIFRIDAWDRNCRQHITPRYTVEEVNALQGSPV